MQNNNDHRYDDMIDLPHHVSSKRSQMSLYDRAAQFSAFKALLLRVPNIEVRRVDTSEGGKQ